MVSDERKIEMNVFGLWKTRQGRFDVAESAQSLATSWSGLKVARIEKTVTSMTRLTLATLFIEWDTMIVYRCIFCILSFHRSFDADAPP